MTELLRRIDYNEFGLSWTVIGEHGAMQAKCNQNLDCGYIWEHRNEPSYITEIPSNDGAPCIFTGKPCYCDGSHRPWDMTIKYIVADCIISGSLVNLWEYLETAYATRLGQS